MTLNRTFDALVVGSGPSGSIAVKELTERGLRPTAPRDAEWGERYCELRDPDGVVISLAEVIE